MPNSAPINSIYYKDRYKEIIKFMPGLQLAELMENEANKMTLRQASTDRHWVYHFLIPKDCKGVYDSYIMTFGIYCHKEKFQVVIKPSILTSIGSNVRRMLYNNLTTELRKIGFRKISYEEKFTRGTNRYPQSFVKILFDENKTLEDLHVLYETIKKYNSIWHEKWIGDIQW